VCCCAQISWSHDELTYTQNKGQWNENVLFRAKMNFGNFYLEEDGFTFLFYNKQAFSREAHTNPEYQMPSEIEAHAVKTKFLNANENPNVSGSKPKTWYENYFIGNDKSKWASSVKSYSTVTYQGLYDYIDLKLYQYANYAKYDFIVDVGGDPSDISFKYEGHEKIYLKNGSLHIKTSMGEIIEKAPLAYQVINGKEVEVPCKYKLKKDVISFDFSKGYDASIPLIIDPILLFSTYSGSTSDNWGFTATYDASEHTYAGGVVFGAGYPLTTGAFQMNFGAGIGVDIGISKFLPDGSNLVYSTYLGGGSSESPHSLVVDQFDNLYVLATTSSTDFPTTVGAFDEVYNGGVSFIPNFYTYDNGSDIAITKFNANGSALIGSTYIGGSGNDGINNGLGTTRYFYGDQFRGDIVLDGAGNCVVTSCTQSTDFLVTGNAPQTANGGGLDAVVFKLNTGLTNLLWSTYWGGSGDDTGFGIQQDSNGDIFISGATSSTNLNTSVGAMNTTNSGGVDGYISKFSANGNNMLASSFLGTGAKDLTFFVEIDASDDIYVIGVSEGAYPVTPGLYSNANSNQFIQKLSNDLTTGIWSTVVGTGNGTVDVSPTAFLVNDCGLIYWSGWGGTVNTSSVPSSTTTGLPTTPNAFQSTTTGSDFYFMVLEQNAQSLLYGSFLGGTSGDHVDGGTSRFDKKGIIYHAVCAGCGGNSTFPTTPGVWSTTNNSSNCNLSVFKFGINNIQTLISVPQPYVCIPNSYQFVNNTSGANHYVWYFGDGDSSNLFAPSHVYQDTGFFTVTLIASDSTGCILPDTAMLNINVYAIDDAGIIAIPPICPGDSIDLESYGGEIYSWYPNTNIINGGTHTATVFPTTTTTYSVIVEDSCSIDTASIVVQVYPSTSSTSPDTSICIGSNINISAFGGIAYSWLPEPSLSVLNAQTTNATPTIATMYYVDVLTPDSCWIRDSVFVDVVLTPPVPMITNDTTICLGDSLTLSASGGAIINWTSTYNIQITGNGNATVWPVIDSYYVATFANACATLLDSVLVTI